MIISLGSLVVVWITGEPDKMFLPTTASQEEKAVDNLPANLIIGGYYRNLFFKRKTGSLSLVNTKVIMSRENYG
jgi:hypothetical protein